MAQKSQEQSRIEKELDAILSTPDDDGIELQTYGNNSDDSDISLNSISRGSGQKMFLDDDDEEDHGLVGNKVVTSARVVNYDRPRCRCCGFTCYWPVISTRQLVCLLLVGSFLMFGIVMLGLYNSPWWCTIVLQFVTPTIMPETQQSKLIRAWDDRPIAHTKLQVSGGNPLFRNENDDPAKYKKDIASCVRDLLALPFVDGMDASIPVLKNHSGLLLNGQVACLQEALLNSTREDLHMIAHTIGYLGGVDLTKLSYAFEILGMHDLRTATLHGLLISALESAFNSTKTWTDKIIATAWVMNQTCDRLIKPAVVDQVLYQHCIHGLGHGAYRALDDFDAAIKLCDGYFQNETNHRCC